MSRRSWDAIVVGASFAGLAVARELRGEVLLLDRNEVGAVQTSACGTLLWVPRALGVEESVLQVHTEAVLHTPTRTVVVDVSDAPFCTFDYRRFCRGLLAQTRARFVRAAVTGGGDGFVETTEGRFTAPVIVDCSGWRRVLSRPAANGAHDGWALSFGLETATAYPGQALSFWASPARYRAGIAWLFPVGNGSLVGLGCYAGRTRLRGALRRFLDDLGVAPSSYHGTYLPSRLGPATAGRVFVVGDAAGHCLPLTAEGIRPAIFFGQACGRIAQRVLDGALTLEQGLEDYRRRVARYRRAYRQLRLGQWALTHAPGASLGAIAAFLARPDIKPRWWPRYSRFGWLELRREDLADRPSSTRGREG